METVVAALRAQMAELDAIVVDLADVQWQQATRCPGWTVADVVLHLAQTDAYAAASARGERLHPEERTGWTAPGEWDETVDEAVGAMVACAPHQRVQWVTGDLAARTLASTRLSECWIHTGDVADAVGVELVPTDRLWHIARLAHRTLPYAFARAGGSLRGPVTFRLTAPADAGEKWTFGDEASSETTLTGPAFDLCRVAAQRAAAGPTRSSWRPDPRPRTCSASSGPTPEPAALRVGRASEGDS